MKKGSTVRILKKVIIGLVLSSLVSFLIYSAAAVLLKTVFYHDQFDEWNRDLTPIFICMIFIFQLAFWICYTRKTSDEFRVMRKDSFSWKEDFCETMKGEGKIIMIVMTVLAVINELVLIIYPLVAVRPGNHFVTLMLLFMFSLEAVTGLATVPVLRTLLAFLVTTSLMILQIVWQHSRDFKKWSDPGRS